MKSLKIEVMKVGKKKEETTQETSMVIESNIVLELINIQEVNMKGRIKKVGRDKSMVKREN